VNPTTEKGRGAYKRAFDLALLIGAHVLLFPLWLLLWVVIPLGIILQDGLPVFFRQQRVGREGRVYTAYKFRTMVKDAEKRGPIYTTECDPKGVESGTVLEGHGAG